MITLSPNTPLISNSDLINNELSAATGTPEGGISIRLEKGIWYLDETIVIPSYCRITLESGALITRDISGTKEPFFRFEGESSSLVGESKNLIYGVGKGFTKGLIYLGHEELNSNTFDNPKCMFNQVSNIHLKVNKTSDLNAVGSHDPTNESIGIYMNCNQGFHSTIVNKPIKTVVYFNTISNCVISNVKIGIQLNNFCNANCIENIIFNRVGNIKGGSAINFHNGSGQNRLSNLQHHFAKDSTSLHFTYDPSSKLPLNDSNANFIQGLITEGLNAVGIRMDNPKKTYQNIFILHSNGKNGGVFPLIPATDSMDEYFDSATNHNCVITPFTIHQSRLADSILHN